MITVWRFQNLHSSISSTASLGIWPPLLLSRIQVRRYFYTAAKWHFGEWRGATFYTRRVTLQYLQEVLLANTSQAWSPLNIALTGKRLNKCLRLLPNFAAVQKCPLIFALWSFCRELCSQIAHCSLATSATIGALPADRPLFVPAQKKIATTDALLLPLKHNLDWLQSEGSIPEKSHEAHKLTSSVPPFAPPRIYRHLGGLFS